MIFHSSFSSRFAGYSRNCRLLARSRLTEILLCGLGCGNGCLGLEVDAVCLGRSWDAMGGYYIFIIMLCWEYINSD